MDLLPERLILASDALVVELLPAWGGKMASFRTKPEGYEFMCPPPLGPHVPVSERFMAADAYGFDELFPGVLPEPYPAEPYRQERILDHGNLWFRQWEHRGGGDEAELWTEDESLGYRFSKHLWFEDARTLATEYTVENRGPGVLHWRYSAHILFPFHDGVELELPPGEYTRLELHGQGLPERARADHPILATGNRFPPGAAGFYIGDEMGEGTCAYLDRVAQKRLALNWTRPLAYMGVWYNRGGWMASQPVTHLGLEPSTARFASLAECIEAGQSHPLQPGESISWRLIMAYDLA